MSESDSAPHHVWNPPPGWPPAPEGWIPPVGWQPLPEWPLAPDGWQFWLPTPGRATLPDPRPTAAHRKYNGYNGNIDVGETELTILREGVLARTTFGKVGPRSIPMTAVAGVRLNPATRLKNGHLQILLAGEEDVPELGTTTAASNVNTVVFTHKGNESFGSLFVWLQGVAERNRAEGLLSKAEGLVESSGQGGRMDRLAANMQAKVDESAEKEEQRKKAKRDADTAAGVLLKLSSVLKTVTFYRDRIELDEPYGTKKERTSIPYYQIDSVEIEGKRLRPSAMLMPEIMLAPKKKTLTIRAGKVKHEFEFRRASDDDMKRAYELIQEGVAASRQQHVTATSAPPPPTAADEIRSLAKLVDKGLITQEEFDAKKRQILGL